MKLCGLIEIHVSETKGIWDNSFMKTLYSLTKHYFLSVVILMTLAVSAWGATSVAQEIDMGKKIDVEVMKKYPLYQDEKAQKEIEEYGQKLAKGVKRSEIPYHFKILKDNDFNAFSIPGGYVYFTDRLWSVMRKDERIGVLGHEITHVDKRHAIDALSKQQRRQIWLSVLLTAVKANDIWSNVAGLAEQIYSLKFSRADEEQADMGAVELCQKAGYNPTGILLAMRKIQRFESESGGAPPKILSDHPPSKERLQYLTKFLAQQGVTVPPDNIDGTANPYRIGDVVSVNANSVSFTSSKPLKSGDVVWIMREGWDIYYEKHSDVPAARAIVTGTGSSYTASFKQLSTDAKSKVIKGMGIYSPPLPASVQGVGYIRPISKNAGLGRLDLGTRPQPLDRLLAMQVVWNKDKTQLINDSVGYIVITKPDSNMGYLPVTRSQYSYAAIDQNSILVPLDDPDKSAWIGPIISVGRGSQAIEVQPNRTLDPNKIYDVTYPAWVKEESYKKRIVGTAKFKPEGQKIVLKMISFTGGWDMSNIQVGFDIYEQNQEVK